MNLSDQTRSVLQNLDTLRQEHHLLSNSSNDNDNKRQSIEQSSESISLAIDEAQLMIELEKYFQSLDSEREKLSLQVQRLTQENNWLRDELSLTEEHLQISTQHRLDYERDIQLLNESLAAVTNETNQLNLINTIDIDIDKEFPHESSINVDRSLPSSSNIETKNYSEIPPRFRTLHNLVIQYAQAGRYEVAVPLCRQALEDLEKTHGHEHPDVATMLNILALVYRDQNKFKEALDLLTEALAIREKTLGYDHPAVAATLNNLAVLYGKKNRYKDAEPLCKRALEIREKSFGVDHPDVAKQLNNLALLCLNQGKYDKVEDYYKRAINIYLKSYGPTDINVIKTKSNLASAYLREGKFHLAFQVYQQVLKESATIISNEQSSSVLTRDSQMIVNALKNLSALCRRQTLYEQADELESCINQFSQRPSESIERALTTLQKLRLPTDYHHQDPLRRSQQSSSTISDYGRLRRSGSFQKLRQSIRRGSEKLVQKLRGTPTNLPSLDSMQFSSTPEPLKRASSMSVLSAFPLQQQQINRTLTVTYSTDHQDQTKQHSTVSIGRDRRTSTENLR